MLKNAAITVGAFRGMLDEVFANTCQVLLVQTWLTLELLLSMCKSASLLLVLIFTHLVFQPKFA